MKRQLPIELMKPGRRGVLFFLTMVPVLLIGLFGVRSAMNRLSTYHSKSSTLFQTSSLTCTYREEREALCSLLYVQILLFLFIFLFDRFNMSTTICCKINLIQLLYHSMNLLHPNFPNGSQ